jgi:hypothetical protein
MRLSIDLDTLAVSDYTGGAVQALSARRGDVFPVRVRFTQGGVGRELPQAATGKLAVKALKDYSGSRVAGSAAWRRVGYGSSAQYVFQLDLSVESVSQAFAADSGELAQVTFALEIEWMHRGERHTSRAVSLVVDNDYIRADEA